MKATQLDHINPCGRLASFNDLSGFAERLFCEADQLRVLCKPCHKEITNAARHVRGKSAAKEGPGTSSPKNH